MPTSVIEQIRRAARDGAGLRDGELLGRFVDRRDEAALAALVNRHGPMVWAVCRRHLSHHDAEDAFQATFIVLVRKASSITHREAVGNWLYGVARQAALQARRTAGRRREAPVTEMPDVQAPQDRWADVRPVLDEELSRLPDHYRAVLVLSDLEGKTRKEVAEQLGCPDGTVASRLARARAMLAKRLVQRGIALTAGALTALFQDAAFARVPSSVSASTIKTASLFATGRAAIPLKVAALTEGVLKAMLLTKLKNVLGVLVATAMVGLIGFGVAAGQQKGEATQRPASEKSEKVIEKAVIAWGQEVDGLQVGLVADAGTCLQGEKLKLTVKVRNVGKADIKFTYGLLQECGPQITTADGAQVTLAMPPLLGVDIVPSEIVIKPGETITLYNPQVAVESEARTKLDGEMRVNTPTIYVAPGKYKIVYGDMIQSHPKLSTGVVDFEVKEPAKAVEAFTEWGKESGGLQAGLGYKAGEKRAYGLGETVTLVVRVRNVSKEAVKFRYCRETFFENPPTLTNAKGKPIPLERDRASGFAALVPVNLAPGKEIEVGERQLELKPTLYATGKFSVQYEALETAANDKTLSQLATGKLELEVRDKAPDSEYPTADVVVQYRDESGRDRKQFRVEDAETVAKLASHFPGILGEKGSGPRASAGNRATLTIKFNHKSGEASQMRVVHVTADFATWWWRDNTPYTGDRPVEGKDQLKSLMEGLAAKSKVELK